MTPEQLTICLVTFILVVGGFVCFRAWLEKRKQDAIILSESQKTKDHLESLKYASDNDLKRWQLLLGAESHIPEIGAIVRSTEKGRVGLIKAASQVQEAEIEGCKVLPLDAKRLLRTEKPEEIPGRLDGIYKVQKVDTTVSDGFRVQLRHEETGQVFTANVRERLLSEGDREKIQQGEWSKKPIEANVNVMYRNDQVTDAVVEKVIRVVEDETDAA